MKIWVSSNSIHPSPGVLLWNPPYLSIVAVHQLVHLESVRPEGDFLTKQGSLLSKKALLGESANVETVAVGHCPMGQ